MNLRKGYNLFIHSWENDGDCRDTKHLVLKSEDEVKSILDFCKLFRSQHDRPPGIGNLLSFDENRLRLVGKENKGVIEKTLKIIFNTLLEESDDRWEDIIIELGYELGLSGVDFYTRVFDGFDVYLLNENPVNLKGNF